LLQLGAAMKTVLKRGWAAIMILWLTLNVEKPWRFYASLVNMKDVLFIIVNVNDGN